MTGAAFCPSRVPSELKKRIQQARLEKKLTQAQLGQLINEKPNVCIRPLCSLCLIPDIQLRACLAAAELAGLDCCMFAPSCCLSATHPHSLPSPQSSPAWSHISWCIDWRSPEDSLRGCCQTLMLWHGFQVIQEYENGKAIPAPAVLSKLSRVLGVQLSAKKK